jgi:uncharacterized protein (TIGR02145 family)
MKAIFRAAVMIGVAHLAFIARGRDLMPAQEGQRPLSVLVLLGEWFGDSYFPLKEEIEARGWTMKRVGIDVEYRGCYNKKRDVVLRSDILIPDLKDFSAYDCLIIPSGPQFRKFRENPKVLQFVRDAHAAGLLVASFCVGNNVVRDAGLIDLPYGPALFSDKVTLVRERILLGPRGGGPPPGDGYESAPIKELCDAIARQLQSSGTFIDSRDGEIYKWIRIGRQVWMAENLRSTSYRDGTPVPTVPTDDVWSKLGTGALCWPDNEPANKNTYGALYNYYAVADGRNICPEGWHVPTIDEWRVLENQLGGKDVAGGRMKDLASNLWKVAPTGEGNESGLSAVPAGGRGRLGSPVDTGRYATWWSSTSESPDFAWHWGLYPDRAEIRSNPGHKGSGFSVRCVKDE